MYKGVNLTTDHDTMLSVREGEVEMLGLLFEKHHKNLYNFFRRQTGIVQESEDLVQEVFLRMLKYRHTYRDEGNFKVWMFKIAHNARNDYYKRYAQQKDHVDEVDQLISNDPSPDKIMERESEIEILQQALNLLPADRKELILMSRFNNLNYKEIGTILGCTEGTVKVRMYRAMKELSEKYFDLTGEKNHEL